MVSTPVGRWQMELILEVIATITSHGTIARGPSPSDYTDLHPLHSNPATERHTTNSLGRPAINAVSLHRAHRNTEDHEGHARRARHGGHAPVPFPPLALLTQEGRHVGRREERDLSSGAGRGRQPLAVVHDRRGRERG